MLCWSVIKPVKYNATTATTADRQSISNWIMFPQDLTRMQCSTLCWGAKVEDGALMWSGGWLGMTVYIDIIITVAHDQRGSSMAHTAQHAISVCMCLTEWVRSRIPHTQNPLKYPLISNLTTKCNYCGNNSIKGRRHA